MIISFGLQLCFCLKFFRQTWWWGWVWCWNWYAIYGCNFSEDNGNRL